MPRRADATPRAAPATAAAATTPAAAGKHSSGTAGVVGEVQQQQQQPQQQQQQTTTHHPRRPGPAHVVAELEQQVAARRAEIGELQRSGLRLRKQEELLLQTLQHQGDVLRVKARLALARRDADDVDAATIDALVKDVEAGLLLQQVQGGGGGGSRALASGAVSPTASGDSGGGRPRAPAPYTSRMLSEAMGGDELSGAGVTSEGAGLERGSLAVGSNTSLMGSGAVGAAAAAAATAASTSESAVTAGPACASVGSITSTSQRTDRHKQPELTVAEVEAAPLEALAAILQNQTMRLALALAQEGKRAGGLLVGRGDTIEEAVDAYSRTNQLLHAHADTKLLQLCPLNLETLQEEQPPEGFWQQVTTALQLTAEQREALAAAFEIFERRRGALADEVRTLSAALTSLLEASSPVDAMAGPAAGARPSAAGASGSADAQPPAALWQQLGPGGAGWAQAPASERAEPLLAQLLAASTQLREVGRALVIIFVNQMTCRQLAVSAVESWPFLCQPVSIAAVVAAEARLAVVADAPVLPPGRARPPPLPRGD